MGSHTKSLCLLDPGIKKKIGALLRGLASIVPNADLLITFKHSGNAVMYGVEKAACGSLQVESGRVTRTGNEIEQ